MTHTAEDGNDLTSRRHLIDSARQQHRDVTRSWPCAYSERLVHTDGPCPAERLIPCHACGNQRPESAPACTCLLDAGEAPWSTPVDSDPLADLLAAAKLIEDAGYELEREYISPTEFARREAGLEPRPLGVVGKFAAYRRVSDEHADRLRVDELIRDHTAEVMSAYSRKLDETILEQLDAIAPEYTFAPPDVTPATLAELTRYIDKHRRTLLVSPANRQAAEEAVAELPLVTVGTSAILDDSTAYVLNTGAMGIDYRSGRLTNRDDPLSPIPDRAVVKVTGLA